MKKRLLSLLLVCVLTAGNVMPVYAVPDVPAGTETETETDDNEDIGGEGVDTPSPSVSDEESSDNGTDDETTTDSSETDESEGDNETDLSTEESEAESETETDSLAEEGTSGEIDLLKDESNGKVKDSAVLDDTEYPTGNVVDPDEPIAESVKVGRNDEIEMLGAGELEDKYINPNLSSLKNQNPYGTCWAFSSVALAEMNLLQQGKVDSDVDLSELHLAYYTYHSVVDPLGGTAGDSVTYNDPSVSFLNRGGNLETSSLVWASWMGVTDEDTVPYSKASTASSLHDDEDIAYHNDAAHLKESIEVNIAEDPEEVKRLVKENGAVGISIHVINSMSAATNGNVYDQANNCYYDETAYEGNSNRYNHAVTIVGWDDNFSKSKFSKTPEGDGAWLIRNSWSTGSYEDNQDFSGYFWLSYYDKNIYANAHSFVFDDAENYDNNYQYDGSPSTRYYGYMDSTTGANIFTAHAGEAGESIKAVAFSTNNSNISYTIKVYKDLEDLNDPSSGDLVSTESGVKLYPGYYTVELTNPVDVNSGDKFSVVVTIDTEGKYAYFDYERNYELNYEGGQNSYRMTAYAEEGQSFISYDGRDWSDFGKSFGGNLRIKAFTDNADTGVLPENILFEDDLDETGLSLGLSETYKVRYNVLPSNTGNKKVTWESSDESIVSVSEKGMLTGNGLGTAVITVRTEAGEVERSFTVTVVRKIISISISCNEDVSQIQKGDECQFAVNWLPEDLDPLGTVEWSSSNDDILQIDETGKALCKGVGRATISASLDGKTAECECKCYPQAPDFELYADKNNIVTITWKAVDGAEKYVVKRGYSSTSPVIAEVTPSEGQDKYTCTDEYFVNSESNITQYYSVYAYESGWSMGSRTYVYIGPTYDITYHLDGGINSDDNPDFYRYTDFINLQNPTPPVGYTFDGWYTDPDFNSRISYIYNRTGAFDLYAKYSPKRYTVRYYSNDGSNYTGSQYAYYGSAYTINYSSFTRVGYDLAGWNTEPDGSGTSYSNGASVLVNDIVGADQSTLNLYAQWTPKTYEITLYANNGSFNGAMSCQYNVTFDAQYGEMPVPTRKGHRFVGWNTSKNGTGNEISNESIFKYDKSNSLYMYLYAQWTPIIYKITLDPNGGTLTETEIEREYNAQYGNIGTPVRPGYTFAGWYPMSNGGTKIESTTRVTKDEDHTIYAMWDAARYRVLFDTCGANTVDDIIVTYNQKYGTLPVPVMEGCQFLGWYDSIDDDAVLVTKDSIVEATEDHTLFARWKTAPYEVSFDAKGGSTVTDKITVVTGEPYGELPVTTRSGYDFAGWYTFEDEYEFGDETTSETIVTEAGPHTLYAHWTAKTYKVTLNANGGTIDGLATKDIDATYDDKYGLSDEPVYPGYDFEGWFTDAAGGDKITSDTTVVTAGDHILYAHWSVASFTVTFDVNGGTELSDTDKTKSVTYNTPYGELPVPVRKGYGFAGWYTDASAGDIVTADTSYVNTDDSILHAHWNIILPASISITDIGKLYIGQKLTLSAAVNEPDNAYTDIRWDRASEYSEVISVTEAGELTALGAGSAKVTATAYDDAGNVCVGADEQPVKAELDIVVIDYVKPDHELRILDFAKTPSIYGSSNPNDFASMTLYGDIEGEPAGVELNWKDAKLKVGEKIKLKADFLPKEIRNGRYVDTISDREVIWHSDNAAIASVASDGTVTAKAGGRAVVTVRNRDDSLIAACKVYVYDPVTAISLNTSSATLGYDNVLKLKVTSIMPTTANQHVTWKNSNDSIALIESQEGNVITVRANDTGKRGKTVVTAIAEGGKSAKCTITVGMPVEKIEVRTKGNVDKVAAGKTLQLSAVLNDGIKTAAPVNKTVEWQIVSGTDLASVSSKGLITAYKEGVIEVVARSTSDVDEGGEPVCSEPVSLNIYVPVKKASLSDTKLTIASGKSYDLDVDIVPAVNNANAAGAATGSELGIDLKDEIVWSLKNASDSSYLDVDPTTGMITAVVPYNKVIPVNATFIPYGAARPTVLTCNVTVADKQISKISLNKKSLTIGVGMTEMLKAALVPNVPVEDGITWSSSDPEVAYVDPYTGVVEGMSSGTAVITVTSDAFNSAGRQVTAICTVTVTDKPITMTVSDSKGNEIISDIPPVAVKKKVGLRVKLYGDTEKSVLSPLQAVRYESLDPRIAKVDAKGNVTGVSNGTAVIRITAAYDPELYVEKSVTVYTASKKVILDKKKSNMSTVIDDEKYDSSYAQYDVLTAMTDSDKINADLEGDYGKIVWTLSDPTMAEVASIDPEILKDYETSEEKQNELANHEDEFGVYDPSDPITTQYGESLAIKALKPGTLKITATDPYSGKKAVCSINIYTHVNGVNVTVSRPKNAAIEDGKMTLGVKGKATLKSTVITSEPAAAKYIVNKNVSYRSSAPQIVSVDKKGRIKALQKGTAIVTITTADGGIEKKITVNVD